MVVEDRRRQGVVGGKEKRLRDVSLKDYIASAGLCKFVVFG